MIISYLLIVQISESNVCMQVILDRDLEIQNEELCKYGNVSSSKYSFIVKETQNVVGCLVSALKRKCVYVAYIDNKLYMIPVVNTVETGCNIIIMFEKTVILQNYSFIRS